MATKKALVIIADGTEEMEAVIAIDVMRRANVSSKLIEWRVTYHILFHPHFYSTYGKVLKGQVFREGEHSPALILD